MLEPKLIDFSQFGSETGQLTVAEIEQHFHFEPKRFYWINHVPEGETRGNHAHKLAHNLHICFGGTIEVTLIDKKGKSFVFELHGTSKGLYIPPEYWIIAKFKDKATLMVVGSEKYSPDEYERDQTLYGMK